MERRPFQTFFKDLPPEGCDPETAVAQHQSLLQRLFSAAYEIQQLQQDAEAGTRGLHNQRLWPAMGFLKIFGFMPYALFTLILHIWVLFLAHLSIFG